MNRLPQPVVTLLAPSESAALRSRDTFCKLFATTEIDQSSLSPNKSNAFINTHDGPDDGCASAEDMSQGIYHVNEFFDDSILLKDANSNGGAIIHLLPLKSSSALINFGEFFGKRVGGSDLSLLSITQQKKNPVGDYSALDARKQISKHINEKHRHAMVAKLKIAASKLFGRSSTSITSKASSIFLEEYKHILLDLPSVVEEYNENVDSEESTSGYRIKELAIPFFPHISSPALSFDHEFYVSCLARPKNSMTGKPVIGLFQWPQQAGVAFRPIPAAREDIVLPHPSLVFQCSSLDVAADELSNFGVDLHKVGFTSGMNRGNNKRSMNGQLAVVHPDFGGLDVRVCDGSNFNAGFAENQEALMASSLSELQNANVLAEGGGGHQQRNHDFMNGIGDCWVEFRAQMKKPSGFFGSRKRAPLRIAKPPDLPPE